MIGFSTTELVTCVFAALAAYNLAFTMRNLYDQRAWLFKSPKAYEYSYIGNDFPPNLLYNSQALPPVGMTLMDSMQYPLTISNSTPPSLIDETWETLTTNPHGLGWTVLSSQRRMLITGMYHNLHCIRQIQRGIVNRSHGVSTPHHIRHCLGYLRNGFLCHANEALEKGDFMKVDRSGLYNSLPGDRVQVKAAVDTMQCRDWSMEYDFSELSWYRWMDEIRINETLFNLVPWAEGAKPQ